MAVPQTHSLARCSLSLPSGLLPGKLLDVGVPPSASLAQTPLQLVHAGCYLSLRFGQQTREGNQKLFRSPLCSRSSRGAGGSPNSQRAPVREHRHVEETDVQPLPSSDLGQRPTPRTGLLRSCGWFPVGAAPFPHRCPGPPLSSHTARTLRDLRSCLQVFMAPATPSTSGPSAQPPPAAPGWL